MTHEREGEARLYARVYDETLYQQFKIAMSRLEAIEVDAWPSPGTGKQNPVGVALGGGA
jgi:hypothetical protein